MNKLQPSGIKARRPRMLYIQYTNPAAYPPLERSAHLLAKSGWDVLFLGAKAENNADFTLASNPHIRCHLLPSVRRGLHQKIQYFFYMLWAVWWTIRWNPQWVYASELLSTPIALILSYIPVVKVLYHEHDFPEETATIFVRFLLSTRKKLAQRANLIVIPNAVRAERFITEHSCPPNKVMVVWNCPSLSEVSRVEPSSSHEDEEPFWLLFHGSIVPTRLPQTFIVALSQLPPCVKLRIVGYETTGAPGYVGRLLQLAETLHCRDRVHYVGSLSTHQELFDWVTCSHLGIAVFAASNLNENEKAMAGASNKAFEYLVGGLPFLVNQNLNDWPQLYVEPGYAISCDPTDYNSIRRVVQDIILNYPMWKERALSGRQRVLDEWNYETQFLGVLSHINDSIEEEN